MNKAYRLRKNREFQYVYRRGKSSATAHMVLIVAKRRDKGIKIGFSISKKIGCAVVRNRIKRQMREAVRLEIPRIKPGHTLIFVARTPITKMNFGGLQKDMVYLMKRTKMWMEEP